MLMVVVMTARAMQMMATMVTMTMGRSCDDGNCDFDDRDDSGDDVDDDGGGDAGDWLA